MLPFLRHAAILAQCITVNVCRRLLLIFIVICVSSFCDRVDFHWVNFDVSHFSGALWNSV